MDSAYLCYWLLGCGTLFPWNAFITAADYYNSRFPSQHVERLVTVVYLPVNLAVLLAMIRYHHHALATKLRIVGGFVIFTLAVSVMPWVCFGPAPLAHQSLAPQLQKGQPFFRLSNAAVGQGCR